MGEQKRLDQLDGLRAIAALMVFCGHARVPGFPGGFLGVDIFFVLSGYLITANLATDYARAGSIDVKAFYLDRTLRLMPALLALVVVYVVVFPRYLRADVLPAITYTINWTQAFRGVSEGYLSHTWSLAQEQQFYLLWPLLLPVFIVRRRWPWLIGLGTASALWCAHLTLSSAPWERLVFAFDTRALGILLGCALALMPVAGRGAVARWWLPATLVIAWFLSWATGDQSAIFVTIGSVCAVSIVAALTDTSGAGDTLQKALSFKPLVSLGAISYAFYLWHYPIIMGLHDATGWRFRYVTLIGLPLTILAASISWVVVERPALRLRKRLRSSREPIKSSVSVAPRYSPEAT